MTNCGSRTVSGFNHILEEMFQYYVKSIITNNECMQSSCASLEVPGIFSCCSIIV